MFKNTMLAVVTVLFAGVAYAQDSGNNGDGGECTGGLCGTPEQTGGGCGCGCGCSILIAFTDQGDTYQYADDFDDDAIEDDFDNCPFTFNSTQVDGDGDGHGDECDNCPITANLGLADSDADFLGDACDPDADNDLLDNPLDNCFLVPNPGQQNTDIDGFGDACDDNDDDDPCSDALDNCPLLSNLDCTETGAIVPNECFADIDADNIFDNIDLCPTVVNPDQADSDGDLIGDLCDQDLDNDGHTNVFDNCINLPNLDQNDVDRDFRGDACDPKLCFVITDEQSCLDPAAPFKVHAGKNILATTTGDPNGEDARLLHIFANRESTAIKYLWEVIESPSDGASAATITNPAGSVSVSSSVEYIYEPGKEARFSTRVPGIYKLRLTAELVHPDDAGYEVRVSQSEVTVEVGGEPVATCASTSPSQLGVTGAALAMLALLRRRRR